MSKVFKSLWFKCIIVLLVIAIISGGLLAILNSVFAVSDEERTKRAVKKIYGEEKTNIITLLDKNELQIEDFGSISKIYVIDKESDDDENFDMLFKSKGTGGYHNGTITVWVKVIFREGQNKKIDKVLLEDYEKQTLMSKLTDNFYNGFLVDITDKYFTAKAEEGKIKNAVTGATYSATAACNAVNCVIFYIRGIGE